MRARSLASLTTTCLVAALAVVLVPSSSQAAYPSDLIVRYTESTAVPSNDASPPGGGGLADAGAGGEGAVITFGVRARLRAFPVWQNHLAGIGHYAPDAFVESKDPGKQVGGDEVLWVEDLAPDGRRVAAHWRVKETGKTGLCINKEGVKHGAVAYCELPNIAEARTLTWRMGSCNGSSSPCNDFSHWVWNTETVKGFVKNGWVNYCDDADYRFGNEEWDREQDPKDNACT